MVTDRLAAVAGAQLASGVDEVVTGEARKTWGCTADVADGARARRAASVDGDRKGTTVNKARPGGPDCNGRNAAPLLIGEIVVVGRDIGKSAVACENDDSETEHKSEHKSSDI